MGFLWLCSALGSERLVRPKKCVRLIKTQRLSFGVEMDDKKMVLALAAVSGAAVGFLIGARFCKAAETGTMQLKSHMAANVNNPLFNYVRENSSREPEPLSKLKKETRQLKIGNADMLSDSDEAQFFRLLLKSIGAKKAIEIGVYTGANLLSTALALPVDGKVVGCETSEEFGSFGKPFFKEANVEHKIDLRIQPAKTTLDELLAAGEAGTYDFVFIDADKTNYDVYYEKSLELLRPGGIVAVDNVFWDGTVWNPVATMEESTLAIHTLNQKIHKDTRVEICMLTIADGVTLAMKL